jgi:ribonucleotide monophosphatase NagD (HAD superfamily)
MVVAPSHPILNNHDGLLCDLDGVMFRDYGSLIEDH